MLADPDPLVTALETSEPLAAVHDVGRTSVSTAIWERPGGLSAGESDQVRLHPYWSERVLARSPALADLARCAGSHHERLDGSGYHRGVGSVSLSRETRLLAAADVMHALREGRPHRSAYDLDTAARILSDEAVAGRLDPDAVAAVIEASGAPRPRRAWPADLTDREVDVLRLAARDLSNKRQRPADARVPAPPCSRWSTVFWSSAAARSDQSSWRLRHPRGVKSGLRCSTLVAGGVMIRAAVR